MPTTASRRAPGPTADRVVEVALELISVHGLDWFSMRKLAAALDVNPMTIYLRFENKEELLAAVAGRGLRQMDLEPPTAGPWADRVVGLAAALRDHLLADRNLLGLYIDVNQLSASLLDGTDHALALMEEAGYRDDEAVAAFRALFWHVVGFALLHHRFDEFPANSRGGLPEVTGSIDAESHPHFARLLGSFTPVDGDTLFLHTTRLLVAGLSAAAPDPAETP